jgi:primosomal protein N' (replication factor Y)
MLVKGHDFPGVTLVVVVLADALFRWPDFRATERAYQVLTQVSGRAGRGAKPGKVLVQAFQTDHPVLKVLVGIQKSEDLIAGERELRQFLNYPPFGRLVRLRVEHTDSKTALQISNSIFDEVSKSPRIDGSLEILGPSEAFLEKVKGLYRYDIVLRSKDVKILHRAVWVAKSLVRNQKWHILIDVDPSGLG